MEALETGDMYPTGFIRSEDSDVSVVDYYDSAITDFSHGPAKGSRTKPKKIIITVTASDLIGYPMFRISQCLSVLRFQKSVLDIEAESDGVYRSLLLFPNMFTLTFPGGLGFTKNLMTSIWRKHGAVGFFRGLPEFVVHKLLCDMMTFVVPVYISPKIELYANKVFKSVATFECAAVSRLREKYKGTYAKLVDEHRSLCFWEDVTFKRFIRRNIDLDPYDFMVRVLVELLTYPMLTISSKMTIYDGKEDMNGFSVAVGTIKNDGLLSLYNGFTWQVMVLLMQHLEKQNEIQKRRLSFTMDDLNTPIDQSMPVFFTIGQMICHQISLVQRCGSVMDGFCNNESSLNILSRFSWLNISSQLLITVCLMHLKDKVLDER
ncbi:hypothetical protein BgAZ_104090 [Babesia gibsoni]|uniref:Uncharacterized protein n=1 Tax=Babesia gibsoni TaxID=33632 RepID=A0AAD8PFI1_BABGI|nr:hypothetical protein BgAZ_104090 [Babesia gibsoni]